MTKCSTCHLPGGSKNFHICLDLTAPLNLSTSARNVLSQAVAKHNRVATNGRGVPTSEPRVFSDSHKKALSEASRLRWARERAAK